MVEVCCFLLAIACTLESMLLGIILRRIRRLEDIARHASVTLGEPDYV